MTDNISPLIKTLTDNLFEAEDRRLMRDLSILNQKNKRLSDVKVDGFLYNGEYFLPKDAALRAIGSGTPALHIILQGDMEYFLADRKTVREEQKFIKQILYTLLSSCKSQQDIRDTLPEFLVGSFPSLSRLPRIEQVAFTIRDNPRAIRQFDKYLPKMEIYSAAKLLY